MYIVKKNEVGLYVNACKDEQNFFVFDCDPTGIKEGDIVEGSLDHYHFFYVSAFFDQQQQIGSSCKWTPTKRLVKLKRFITNKLKAIA